MSSPFFFSKKVLAFLIFFITFFCGARVTAASAEANINFLTLADIHFDPFVSCAAKKSCPLIQKLRQASSNDWPQIFTGYDHALSGYRNDTNYPLLISALAAAKNAVAAHEVKFVIVLGDFLGHNFHRNYQIYAQDKSSQGYQSFVNKTLQFINHELALAFPTTPVYAVIGNNDTYQRDYYTQANGPFLKTIGALWQGLLQSDKNKSQMQSTFFRAGYYAVTLPEPSNLRLIVLNSILFSTHAPGSNTAQLANEQLAWLKNQCQLAHDQKQKIIIAMHIPTGIDIFATLRFRLFTLIQLWESKYIKSFQQILENNATDIVGIFAGHLHSDWYQLITTNDIPFVGTPAISPVFGNNPGFKIISYDTQSQQLKNFQTYYLPINKQGIWKVEYGFHTSYLSNCSFCNVLDEMNKLPLHHLFMSRYRSFYTVNTTTQLSTKKWLPFYLCAMHKSMPLQVVKCIQ